MVVMMCTIGSLCFALLFHGKGGLEGTKLSSPTIRAPWGLVRVRVRRGGAWMGCACWGAG